MNILNKLEQDGEVIKEIFGLQGKEEELATQEADKYGNILTLEEIEERKILLECDTSDEEYRNSKES